MFLELISDPCRAQRDGRGPATRRAAYATVLAIFFAYLGVNTTVLRGRGGDSSDGDLAVVDLNEQLSLLGGTISLKAGTCAFIASQAYLAVPLLQLVFGLRRLRTALPGLLVALAASVVLAWYTAFVSPSAPAYVAATLAVNSLYAVVDLVLDQCQTHETDASTSKSRGDDNSSDEDHHGNDAAALRTFNASAHADQSYRCLGGVVFVLLAVALAISRAWPGLYPVRDTLGALAFVVAGATAPVALALRDKSVLLPRGSVKANDDAQPRVPVWRVPRLALVALSSQLPDIAGDGLVSALVRSHHNSDLGIARFAISGVGWMLCHPDIHVAIARRAACCGVGIMWPALLLIGRAVALWLSCVATELADAESDAGTVAALRSASLALFSLQCLADAIGNRLLMNVGETENRKAVWGGDGENTGGVPSWVANFLLEVVPAASKRFLMFYAHRLLFAGDVGGGRVNAALITRLTACYLAACVAGVAVMAAARTASKTMKKQHRE